MTRGFFRENLLPGLIPEKGKRALKKIGALRKKSDKHGRVQDAVTKNPEKLKE